MKKMSIFLIIFTFTYQSLCVKVYVHSLSFILRAKDVFEISVWKN